MTTIHNRAMPRGSGPFYFFSKSCLRAASAADFPSSSGVALKSANAALTDLGVRIFSSIRLKPFEIEFSEPADFIVVASKAA